MRAFFRFQFSLRILLLAPVLAVALSWSYLRSHRVVERSLCCDCGRVEVTTSYSGRLGSWIPPAQSTRSTDLSGFLAGLGVPECQAHRFAFYDRVGDDPEGINEVLDSEYYRDRFRLRILEQFDAGMIAHLTRVLRMQDAEARDFIRRVLDEFYSESNSLFPTFIEHYPDIVRWRQVYEASRTEDPAASTDR